MAFLKYIVTVVIVALLLTQIGLDLYWYYGEKPKGDIPTILHWCVLISSSIILIYILIKAYDSS